MRNVCRVILIVAVHGNNDLAKGVIKTCHHGRCLSEITPKVKHPHVRVPGGNFVEFNIGAIRAAVINEDQLPRTTTGVHHPRGRLVEPFHRIQFVKDRNHDGNQAARFARDNHISVENIR